MSDRVDSLALRQKRLLAEQEGRANGQPDLVGSWRGEAVRTMPSDAASLLANAKEELTFAHSERMERKSMRERKISAPGGAVSERAEHIQEIEDWLDCLPDLDPRQAAEFLEEARHGGQEPGTLLGRARQRFGDPSHAFAVLDIVEQALRREDATGTTAAVAAAAREALLEAEGPAVRAGVNVSAAAFEVARQDRTAAAALRDLYREVVLGNPAPAAIYRAVLQRFGAEDFPVHLRFLTRGLGEDLAAAGPSIEPERLRETLNGLSGLRVLDTAHERCGLLARRVGKLCGVTPAVTEVMRTLLPLTEQTTYVAGKLSPIPGQLGIPEAWLDARILLMSEARAVMALLPLGIYRDQDSRFALLRSLQDELDRLIEREEEEEEDVLIRPERSKRDDTQRR